MDRLFDVLNSRNPYAQGNKQPLKLANKEYWLGILDSTFDYLMTLRINNVPILNRRRKTFVFGFLCTISSEAYDNSVVVSRTESSYFLTYKFSQDHIELYFAVIRSCGG